MQALGWVLGLVAVGGAAWLGYSAGMRRQGLSLPADQRAKLFLQPNMAPNDTVILQFADRQLGGDAWKRAKGWPVAEPIRGGLLEARP